MLPFQDYDFDLDENTSSIQKVLRTKRPKKKVKASKTDQVPSQVADDNVNVPPLYHLYFENSNDHSDLVSLSLYTGPCNTLHLNKQLYLPQLIQTSNGTSKNSRECFFSDYQRMSSNIPIQSNASICVFIRFGIMYVIRGNNRRTEPLSIEDFVNVRNREKRIKTSFYTSKGVSSPKHLLKTLSREGFSRNSINIYSYDIQFFMHKKDHSKTYHFRYDEQLRCCEILCRTTSPINFDFIRDKSSSIFRSIDDSYADMFDFRIQIQQIQHLTRDDPNVLGLLQGVPIDEVLYMDEKAFNLHVAPSLRQSVKYMKCIRSSKYVSTDQSITISIGSYEEFALNQQGTCESTMKSENTMTIELLNLSMIPSAEKLYDLGMWFSSLCQTCVDQPKNHSTRLDLIRRNRWFSQVFDAWKRNRTIKKRRVDELTRYKTQNFNQYYTNEDIAFVKHLLYTDSWLQIIITDHPNEMEKEFEKLIKRLKSIQLPIAVEALKHVQQQYYIAKEKHFENKL